MSKITIRNCYTGAALWESPCSTMMEAVLEAVAAKADLRYANLQSADLRYADLRYANLQSADLRHADLRYAKNAERAIAMTRILPAGSLIGWKKCRDGIIVKIRVPEEARRSHAFERKCRAEFVDVLEIYGADEALSTPDAPITCNYRVGERVTCNQWDEDWTQTCSGGIHFYITCEEAEAH